MTVEPATPGHGAGERGGRHGGAPAARIASATPGSSRSSTARVASGVRSPGWMPVPPVVRISAGAAATASWIAAAMSASGQITGASIA